MKRYNPTQTHTLSQKHHSLRVCVFVCFTELCLFGCFDNFQERRILEETVQPLNQTGFVNQQSGQMGTTSSAPEHNQTERGNVAPQQNGQSTSTGNEGQHVSKLHFLQGEIKQRYTLFCSSCLHLCLHGSFNLSSNIQSSQFLFFYVRICRFCM